MQSLHGVVLHPASLPGRFGVGEVGMDAARWLQVLGEAGVGAWVLPGGVDDPLLLSFDLLRNDGALLPEDLAMLPGFDDHSVDLSAVREVRWAFLDLAARRFVAQCDASPLLRHALDKFSDQEAAWLDDVALFEAISRDQKTRLWQEWSPELANREPAALDEAMVTLAPQIEEQKALRYLLYRQWRRLRTRAAEENVKLLALIPDEPMPDSAEAWAAVGRELIVERTVAIVDGIVSEATLDEPGWLDGHELFSITTPGPWRFAWADVTEAVLARLVG